MFVCIGNEMKNERRLFVLFLDAQASLTIEEWSFRSRGQDE
jgi:hypothetical protein